MKKIILIILLIALSSTTVFANPNIGDKINDVLYTDIITTINGQEVESFNINGRTAIYVKDAKKLGYDVLFNSDERLVTITNNEELIPKYSDSKLDESQFQNKNIGDKINDVLFTDIKTVINDKAVESFNINNSTAIYATALKNTNADVEWLSDVRRVRISNVNNDSRIENTPNQVNNTSNSPDKIIIDASTSEDVYLENDEIYLNIQIVKDVLLKYNIQLKSFLNENKIILNELLPIPYEKIKTNHLDNTVNVVYSDKIKIPLPNEILNSDSILIVDSNDKEISEITYDRLEDGIIIDKTYHLALGEAYTVKGFSNNEVVSQKMLINKYLTKDSFKQSKESKDFKSVIVPAQPEKGFYFPYKLNYVYRHGFFRANDGYVDYESTKDILFAETINTGQIDQSFEEMIYNAKSEHSMGHNIVRRTNHNGFVMMGIFPRLHNEGGIYTHALDRQTMFGTKEFFDQFERGNLYRIDRQFVAMQKDARMHLEKMGRNVGKPILSGFSGSALFANRLNYLYPDLAKALIIMDSPTMPFEEYNGVELKYPLGVADLEELTGKPFNKEKFLDTPQFWTVGSNDRNDGAYWEDGWGNYHLTREEGDALGIDRNQEGIDYRKAFGDDIVIRKAKIRKILKEHGFTNIEGHTYDVGHYVPGEAYEDIDKFLDKIN